MAFQSPKTPPEAFYEQAKSYTRVVEEAHLYSLSERIEMFSYLLSVLYSNALLLEFPPEDEMSGDTGPRVDQNLGEWPGFEDLDRYWEVFDPYVKDNVVSTRLSNDIIDIYLDLKKGLLVYNMI